MVSNFGVALRKESVDRNYSACQKKIGCLLSLSARRAWIEMIFVSNPVAEFCKSLSARRAWIEIMTTFRLNPVKWVALRKESVDRNARRLALLWAVSVSLSARRAWIEIASRWRVPGRPFVALRKESVDRNLWWGVRKAVGSLVALRKESVDRNCYFGDDVSD